MQHTHPFATLRPGELLVMLRPGQMQPDVRRLAALTRLLPGFAVRTAATTNPNRGTMVVAMRPSVVPGMRPTYISTMLEGLDGSQAREFVRALRDVLNPSARDVMVWPDVASAQDYSAPCNAKLSRIMLSPAMICESDGAAIDDSAEISADLDEQRKEWIDRLSALVLEYVARHHELPPMHEVEHILRGKISLAADGLSPVHVSGDLRIYLPAYNEIELRLAPLPRALYILFLRHPEGIVLKQIGKYRDELDEIYSLVMPGRDDAMARVMIDELTTPGSDSLRQKLSQIKAGVRRYVFDEAKADRYCISGERGKAYRIDLPAEMIHLPAALR